MQQPFFSFVVPAHNEETLIAKTLSCLVALDYPKDRYEVVVVENASQDKTYEIAKQFESDTFHVYSTPQPGVSRARNFGMTKCSPQLDWSIVMDADNFLEEGFLQELCAYLKAHPKAAYGMAEILPDVPTRKARFWFWYRNITDRLLRTMDTIHIVRKDLFGKASYPEGFNFTEDLQYTEALRRYGEYFFMPTKSMSSSTRRFEKNGYVKKVLKDVWIGVRYALNKNAFRDKNWEAIR